MTAEPRAIRAHAGAIALAAALGVSGGVGGHAADSDRAGMGLYRQGVHDPAARAFLGTNTTSVPARHFACANCHGRDGRGGVEGTLRAPAIDGPSLSRTTPRRTPYDAASFAAALATGQGPDGSALDPAMPRYSFGGREADALWTHLARLPERERRGVFADEIRFGVLADPGGTAFAERVAAAAQNAWAARGQPEVFGRRVRFVVVSVDPSDSDPSGALDEAPILAVLFGVDAGGSQGPALRRAGVPTLFPLSAVDGDEDPRDTRALFAARIDQLRTLLAEAGEESSLLVDARGRALLERSGLARDRRVWNLHEFDRPLPPRVVVFGNQPDAVAAFARRPDLRGVTVYGLLDDLGARAADLVDAGAALRLADPRPMNAGQPGAGAPRRPDLDRLLDVAVAMLERALTSLGRDVTRTRLMTALGVGMAEGVDWPALDFRKAPLTGSRAVAIVRLEGTARREPGR